MKKLSIQEEAIMQKVWHRFMRGFVHDYFKDSFKEMVCFFAKEEDLSFRDLVDIIREIERGKE